MSVLSVGTAHVISDQWALRPPGVLASVLRPIASLHEELLFMFVSS